MLTSIAILLLTGMMFGCLFKKIGFPAIIGMIFAGILISPHLLNLVDESFIQISPALRQMALVLILTRAGLSLDVSDLKRIGKPAVLMCFVPACLEIAGVMWIAPMLLNVSIIEAALMGSVLAAVSPAVVVPRMIHLLETKTGTKKGIPQLILAGASVDDIFVIVVFSAVCALMESNAASVGMLMSVPVSIVSAILIGSLFGLLVNQFYQRVSLVSISQFLSFIGVSFLLLELETLISPFLPFSGLLAIMSMGLMIRYQNKDLARLLSRQYNQAWSVAEIFLFVLVGITVDLRYAISAGPLVICLVLGSLIFRMAGVFLCVRKTEFNLKEKVFCMLAYTPKATVQAAIGAIPLSMGLACGELVMTVSVLSILITAPFGAACIDYLAEPLLKKTRGED